MLHRMGDVGQPRVGGLAHPHQLTDSEQEPDRIVLGVFGTGERQLAADGGDLGEHGLVRQHEPTGPVAHRRPRTRDLQRRRHARPGSGPAPLPS